MRTNTVGMNWLIPLLGVVLLGGGYAAARSYLRFEQMISADGQLIATLDRIDEAHSLLLIQRQLQGGGCPEAVHYVDGCLSASVATLECELTSPDERTRAILRLFLERMGRVRSENSPMAARLPAGPGIPELAAQQTLAQGLVHSSPGR